MKTITSARNPLTKKELRVYKTELSFLKWIRNEIKENFKGRKYLRVYTEPQSKGKCRMKLYYMKKKWMKKIYNKYKNHSTFSVEKHIEQRWHSSAYSIILRVK